MNRSVGVVVPVFRPSKAMVARLAATLAGLRMQQAIAGICVVDDGSGDRSMDALSTALEGIASVIALPRNKGRAASRNAGVAQVPGDLLLFLDADCRPARGDYLPALLSAFDSSETVAAGGRLRGDGNPFWLRYQDEAQTRRLLRAADGVPPLTAASLLVSRAAFEECGRFDELYAGYGFEDRDLLLRLTHQGSVVQVDEAVVVHTATIRLEEVAAKLQEAGEKTAGRFAQKHPAAYRALGYAAFDARRALWLRWAGAAVGPLAMWLAARLDPWLSGLPYPVAAGLVRGISAVAFLYGTAQAARDSASA